MGIFSRFLPKRKPVEIKNNVPKEKEEIRKTFGVYCHSHQPGSKMQGSQPVFQFTYRYGIDTGPEVYSRHKGKYSKLCTA